MKILDAINFTVTVGQVEINNYMSENSLHIDIYINRPVPCNIRLKALEQIFNNLTNKRDLINYTIKQLQTPQSLNENENLSDFIIIFSIFQKCKNFSNFKIFEYLKSFSLKFQHKTLEKYLNFIKLPKNIPPHIFTRLNIEANKEFSYVTEMSDFEDLNHVKKLLYFQGFLDLKIIKKIKTCFLKDEIFSNELSKKLLYSSIKSETLLYLKEHIKPNSCFSFLLNKSNIKDFKYFTASINEKNILETIKFWSKNISSINLKVFTKFIKEFEKTKDIKIKNRICDLMVFISKQEKSLFFLNNAILPSKICVYFLKNLNIKEYKNIKRENMFIDLYLKTMERDLSVLNNIQDLLDDEGLKIVKQILLTFDLNTEQIQNILNTFLGLLHLSTRHSEIVSICIIKLDDHLRSPLSKSNIAVLYYLFNNEPRKYKELIPEFIDYFKNTDDYFMCFPIFSILMQRFDRNWDSVIEHIENIINDLSIYHLIELLNSLQHFPDISSLIFRIQKRFVLLLETADDSAINICLRRILCFTNNSDFIVRLFSSDKIVVFKQLIQKVQNLRFFNKRHINVMTYELARKLFIYEYKKTYSPAIVKSLLFILAEKPYVFFILFKDSLDEKINSRLDFKQFNILFKKIQPTDLNRLLVY
ncbi:hypothetical protein CDIK_1845 [Cucumispora dikerogammari]|nr:hypothetical protein CDIK_1845 [Cucumispora dikerogammari]